MPNLGSRISQLNLTVPLSDVITSPWGFHNTRAVGLIIPNVTSCTAFLQVSVDTTSANFKRAACPLSSGDFTFFPGSVGLALAVDHVIGPFPFARLELSVAQSAVRSIAVIGKLR